ncbi:dihydroxyacetone kinase [Purpureocillium lavendulum]|uniref:Dihydroxyacetone kinase n=1 Tax=Purpureocillium lavendulum TaxID=1247861 RepID=A0AB34FQA7_9HYPO|nr:dihydroxyacetone kinase [Purpureocillium lavendulum]
MSKRHLFNSPDGLVNKALRGIIAYNPSLSLDEANRVVYDTAYDRRNVSIISGGGSGHEPAWTGYVGSNMLAASVQGDIFASPSTKQIVAAVEAVPSDKGTILVITNYTGDCLHFGLANEKANARGHNCRMIICGDDVSVGKKGSMVGRRGLAGQIGVLKVMGGAAGAGGSLDDVYDLGVAFSQQIVSIAATLDHCHVPGRTEHGMLDDNEVEIGTGPHNEPGYKKISPAPTPSELVQSILKHCLDENDPERGYVKFAPGDETMLLISNFGGMSHLEMGALVDEVLEQLARHWNMEPSRICAGFLETSLNAPAFSVSVINVTAAAKNCRYSVDEIKSFFDARTNTHWESMAGSQATRRPRKEQLVRSPQEERKTVGDKHDLKVDPVILEKMLRNACEQLIVAEPDLTKWDTVMGDGDCGETLKTGATSLLAALDNGLAKAGSVVQVLLELEDIVESKMGGTLGGILGIFFVSLRAAVEKNIELASSKGAVALWGEAVSSALQSLRRYTPAKIGDRTVMDTLIPFAEATRTGGLDHGVKAAVQGAEATKTMTPRLGRATYVGAGANGNKELPPDPGAWGAMVVVQGDVVLKPSDNNTESQWVGEALCRLTDSLPGNANYRVSKPIPLVDDATKDPVDRFSEILQTSQGFHHDIKGITLDKPAFIGNRGNRWDAADLVTWNERQLTDIASVSEEMLAYFEEPLEELRQMIKPLPSDLPLQLIHGDLTGNVLFDANGRTPPGIIDMTCYWRPAAYAEAIVVADGLAWHAEGRDLVELYGVDEVRIQLLVRALYWRVITFAIDTDVNWIREHIAKADYPKAVEILRSVIADKPLR